MKSLIFLLTFLWSSLFANAQDQVPVPESLIVKNVPPVTTVQIEEFMEFMQAPDPSGDRYQLIGTDSENDIFISKNQNQTLVWDSTEDKFEKLDVNFESGIRFTFHPTEKKTLFIREVSADEKQTLFIHDYAIDSLYPIYESHKRIADYILSPDLSTVFVYEIQSPAIKGTIFRVSLKDPEEVVKVTDIPIYYGFFQEFDSTAKHVYLLGSETARDAKLFKIDLSSGETSLMFDEEREELFYHELISTFGDFNKRFISLKTAPKAFYARTGTFGNAKEFSVLWEVDLETGQKKQISPDVTGDVTQFEISQDEKYVIYAIDRQRKRSLHLYDVDRKSTSTLYDEKPIIKDGSTFLLNGKSIFLSTYNEGRIEILELDITSGDYRTVLKSEKSPVYDEVVLEEFMFPVADKKIGFMKGIPGYLYMPKKTSKEKLPVVVRFHGGPASYEEPYPLMPLLEEVAVINLNYRGSVGYGVSFEKADNGYNRHKQIEDMEYLVMWIKKHPRLDEKKIFLSGGSWGGYMVLASMTTFPDLFSGGFAAAAVSDLPSIASNKFFIGFSRTEVGDVNDPEMLAYLIQNSPYMHGDKIRRPLMLFHGSNDIRVPIENATKMIESIEKNGGNVRYILSKGGHHQGSGFEAMKYKAVALMAFEREMH